MDGLADPRANHFVWFPPLEKKQKQKIGRERGREIKSDPPLRGSGGF
jgi:hypothetical protein